jgi:hypothetical protein
MLDFLVNHRGTERNFVLPDRETAIGQTGNPPEGWDSKRSAEKKTQLSGQFMCKQQSYLDQCSVAEVLPPKAEALFPGRRLPAREKSIFSVTSVSPWLNFFSPTTCYSQIALWATGG